MAGSTRREIGAGGVDATVRELLLLMPRMAGRVKRMHIQVGPAGKKLLPLTVKNGAQATGGHSH